MGRFRCVIQLWWIRFFGQTSAYNLIDRPIMWCLLCLHYMAHAIVTLVGDKAHVHFEDSNSSWSNKHCKDLKYLYNNHQLKMKSKIVIICWHFSKFYCYQLEKSYLSQLISMTSIISGLIPSSNYTFANSKKQQQQYVRRMVSGMTRYP